MPHRCRRPLGEHGRRHPERRLVPVEPGGAWPRLFALHPGADVLARRRAAEHAEARTPRPEEHTSEIQSLMRISDAAFCLKKHIKYAVLTPHTNVPYLSLMIYTFHMSRL